MSMITLLTTMNGLVKGIGTHFKGIGQSAIQGLKDLAKWFNDNVIQPFKDKIDELSWDSIKEKAETAWDAIKTKIGELWDSLPDLPDALTYDYWFGEGGVFNWNLD